MSNDEEPVLFPETTRVKEAMVIINNLEASKLSVVVGRLAKAVGAKSAAAFDESERAELVDNLHLTTNELNTMLEACSFILEQSTYHLVKPLSLFAQLQVVGMGESQVLSCYQINIMNFAHLIFSLGASVCKCLGAGGTKYSQVRSKIDSEVIDLASVLTNTWFSKLRSAPLGGTPILESVDWRVHVQMSRSDAACIAEPTALFNLRLNQTSTDLQARTVDSQESQASSRHRDVALEFSKPQLLEFLHHLDRIQAQLDALGS